MGGSTQESDILAPRCRVFTCARKAEDLEELLAHCKAAGWDVQGTVADVSTADGRAALLAQVSDAFGGQLNVLFNNVGTNVRKPTVDFTEVRRPQDARHPRCGCSTLSQCSAACWRARRASAPTHLSASNNGWSSPTSVHPLQSDWQFLVSTNLESAFMLSQAAFPLLKASRDGVVLFNSR